MQLRLLALPNMLGEYLRLVFWPSGLHFYRSYDILRFPLWGWLGAAVIFLGGVVFVRRASPGTGRLFLFGVGWFLLMFLPVLNIVPLVFEYSYVALFEHFLYTPLPGCLLALAAVLMHVFRRAQGAATKYLRLTLISLFVLMAAWTTRQTTSWQSEQHLFYRAVAFEPQLSRVQILAGLAAYHAGDDARAVHHLQRAGLILDDYLHQVRVPAARTAYFGLKREALLYQGLVLERQGHSHQALAALQEALIIKSDHVILNRIGLIHLRHKDILSAEAAFREAIRLHAEDVASQSNLAVCLLLSGREPEGRQMLRAILQKHPGYPPAIRNLERF